MNLSPRSKLSLCQFLMLFERGDLVLLLGKYGFLTDDLEYGWVCANPTALKEIILPASGVQLGELLQELAGTQTSMRTQVSPRYKFDERWTDLQLCLELDGYANKRDDYGVDLDRFVPTEPNIEDAGKVEDELTGELRRSGLMNIDGIVQVLNRSASAFRAGDFNGCLINARVALETFARSVASDRLREHGGRFDAEKWGQVIEYLRTSEFITRKEEGGIAGVYGLISPGSHTPIGFEDKEFARLGRGLAISMIYFLVKRFNASSV